MDKTKFTDTGGFPLKLDDFLWMLGDQKSSNKGIYDALQAFLSRYGTNFIVQGCVYGGSTLTEGWIMLDGELLAVDAQSGLTQVYFEKVQTFDPDGLKTFKDASVNNTYEINRATLTASSGSLNITTAKTIQDLIVENIPDASTTVKGIQEFATGTETQGLSDTTRGITPGGLNSLNATETQKGIAEVATTAEAKALSADDKIITPLKLGDATDGTLIAIVNLGNWDMDTTISKGASLPGGITSFSQFRGVDIYIINDSQNALYQLAGSDATGALGGYAFVDVSEVRAFRTTGGRFDNSGFSSSSINRGFAIIRYVP